jgi:hypothetical protein
MGGLLRALAGGLKGIGDGMIDKAKADREAAIVALARQGAVQDRDATFAHQDANLATSEAGANSRADNNNATSITTTGMNNATQIADTASNNQTSIRTTGMNNATSTANTGATIAGENARSAAALAHDDGLVDKVLPQPDGSQVVVKKGGTASTLIGDDGKPVQGDVSLSPSQNRLLAVYKSKNVLRDADGAAITDAGGRPQYDWAAIDSQLRGAGKGNVADLLSGQTVQPKNDLVLAPNASAPGATGIVPATSGGGLTSNLFGAPDTPPADTKPVIPPPQGAVAMLRKNPGMRDAFDQKYGQGAAARALGQ